MKIEEFTKELANLGINCDDEKLTLLEKYYNYLGEYNAHTNLTAITQKEDVYLKHFYDSLTIIKVTDLNKTTSLIDVGSGAGFPGIVLKIFYPHLKLTIIDSNNKKTTFVKELCSKLNLKDVLVINARAEDYAKNHEGLYDVCTSRAVAYIDIISSLCLPFIKEEGRVILMKGAFNSEKEVLLQHQKELGIKDYEIVSFNLPKTSDERTLVTLEREKNLKHLNYSQIVKRNKLWKAK